MGLEGWLLVVVLAELDGFLGELTIKSESRFSRTRGEMISVPCALAALCEPL